MVVPSASTCTPWATAADVCAPCDAYDFDALALDAGLQAASDVLFNLTGRRWAGACAETIRPSVCGCAGDDCCGCGGVSEVALPGYPAVEIIEVLIDGVVVDPARYRIDNHRQLVYQPDYQPDPGVPSRGRWPCCQSLQRPAGEPGTWTVEYLFGQNPPPGGVAAAATLGCQLALACNPDMAGACQLPKRVTTITRQGITLAVIDPLTLFADGLTGLPDVDLWVQSVRLGDARRRGSVWVPGRRRGARRTTWP